jgi:lauroyl/myristoyl acyltransferase
VLRVLGSTAWILLGSERGIAREQIARAFPELPSDVRDGMGRRSLLRLGDNLLDMVRGDASVRFPEGERRKLTDLLASGPVLVLMAHSGAWELVGSVLVQATGRFGAVTAEPHNPWVPARARGARHSLLRSGPGGGCGGAVALSGRLPGGAR